MKQFATADWRTSNYSGSQGDCVEAVRNSDAVGVRDTKNRPAGHLTLSSGAWQTLLGEVRRVAACP